MHKGYLVSLARNTKIYKLLDEVIDLAEKNEIKVVLLKGLALEKTIYGNKGLRQMNDLDILVKREDAIRFRKILLASGFVSMPMMSPLHEKILPNYGKHLPEMFKVGLAVEIHFSLFDKNSELLTNGFIERSTETFHNSNFAFIPSLQDHFLFLVKHLGFHERTGTSQLRLYTDLLLLSESLKEQANNQKIEAAAADAGINDLLFEKRLQLKLFFNSHNYVPPTTDNELVDKFLTWLERPDSGKPMPAESILKPLSGLKGIKNKIHFVYGLLFPSREFMIYRYGIKTWYSLVIYYPFRLFTAILSLTRLRIRP